jgi:hypothetical protein
MKILAQQFVVDWDNVFILDFQKNSTLGKLKNGIFNVPHRSARFP